MAESQETDSPIPRALLRCPRIVRRKPGTLIPVVLGRIFTAPLLLICVAVLGFAILDAFVVLVVPAQTARIVSLLRDVKPRRSTAYYVNYKFDKSAATAWEEVLPGEFKNLHIEQALQAHAIHLGPLYYSTLHRSWIAYVRYRMILWLGASFSLVMGGVLFHSVWILPWEAHWLTQHGKTTYGAIVEKRIVRVRQLHGFFTLTYQFKALGKLRARQIRISPRRYDSAGVKDLVIILFDPARPNRNIIYDYSDFIAS